MIHMRSSGLAGKDRTSRAYTEEQALEDFSYMEIDSKLRELGIYHFPYSNRTRSMEETEFGELLNKYSFD